MVSSYRLIHSEVIALRSHLMSIATEYQIERNFLYQCLICPPPQQPMKESELNRHSRTQKHVSNRNGQYTLTSSPDRNDRSSLPIFSSPILHSTPRPSRPSTPLLQLPEDVFRVDESPGPDSQSLFSESFSGSHQYCSSDSDQSREDYEPSLLGEDDISSESFSEGTSQFIPVTSQSDKRLDVKHYELVQCFYLTTMRTSGTMMLYLSPPTTVMTKTWLAWIQTTMQQIHGRHGRMQRYEAQLMRSCLVINLIKIAGLPIRRNGRLPSCGSVSVWRRSDTLDVRDAWDATATRGEDATTLPGNDPEACGFDAQAHLQLARECILYMLP